ncbi:MULTISPECIES: PH domain-containing protein [unclassified Flavobacterium]|uniref:PH domain-containing protein n=1 Tax=unclassified Flavobacterium TaxID=196869 RepID=UPI000C18DC3E|nr:MULTISPECIES: PH domain-containing protein [unclassified Flavobacterium]PIF61018.1 PH (Pleckstrin Homology) domain-containing protein [Flavobacterium sp. 11]RKS12988.1 PH (Pleckstrin Homology) domain-containing protein [Flavobacterium sp. 120]WKL45404.1 PH domain-containing protein [Flavobacterium sp. ZE23DGlu08]
MKEQFKKFLNEEQDPKAIEKIASKLSDLLMKNEEIGYIAVQKKPAITVLPDSIVMTNKRIIICQPKNLGLSMNFIDYTWDEIEGTFVKENILGSEFSFTTRTNMEVSIDYIPKIQARKIFTYAKEQLDILKVGSVLNATMMDEVLAAPMEEVEIIEEMETEEVTSFAEIMPISQPNFSAENQEFEAVSTSPKDKSLNDLSQDELFEKLQNYKKLLDNGLILQGEYDAFKKEILSYM